MEYAILKSHSAEELEKRVNVFLEEGFEPVGGISVTSESTDCRYQNLYCQAVLRPDKVDAEPDPTPDTDPNPNPDLDPDPTPSGPDIPFPPEPDPDQDEDETDPSKGDGNPDGGDTEPKEDDTSNLGNLRLFK